MHNHTYSIYIILCLFHFHYCTQLSTKLPLKGFPLYCTHPPDKRNVKHLHMYTYTQQLIVLQCNHVSLSYVGFWYDH